MKVTLENFRKIQEYKKLGLSQKKTATNLSLTLSSVRKWWDLTEEDLLNVEKTRAEYLDNYKEFMLSQLHKHNAPKRNKKHHIYNEQRVVLMGRCGGGQASDANVN